MPRLPLFLLPQDNWGGVVVRFQEVEEFNFDLQEP